MSKQANSLGDDIDEALAEAFMVYKDRITEILKPFSDEQLLAFSGEVTPEEVNDAFESRHLVPRMVAQTEVGYRQCFARAKAVMKADPNVKVYCVFHDQDASKCDPKDHE